MKRHLILWLLMIAYCVIAAGCSKEQPLPTLSPGTPVTFPQSIYYNCPCTIQSVTQGGYMVKDTHGRVFYVSQYDIK